MDTHDQVVRHIKLLGESSLTPNNYRLPISHSLYSLYRTAPDRTIKEWCDYYGITIELEVASDHPSVMYNIVINNIPIQMTKFQSNPTNETRISKGSKESILLGDTLVVRNAIPPYREGESETNTVTNVCHRRGYKPLI